jgi:hypothetical protein
VPGTLGESSAYLELLVVYSDRLERNLSLPGERRSMSRRFEAFHSKMVKDKVESFSTNFSLSTPKSAGRARSPVAEMIEGRSLRRPARAASEFPQPAACGYRNCGARRAPSASAHRASRVAMFVSAAAALTGDVHFVPGFSAFVICSAGARRGNSPQSCGVAHGQSYQPQEAVTQIDYLTP